MASWRVARYCSERTQLENESNAVLSLLEEVDGNALLCWRGGVVDSPSRASIVYHRSVEVLCVAAY